MFLNKTNVSLPLLLLIYICQTGRGVVGTKILLNLRRNCTENQNVICTFKGINATIDTPLFFADEQAPDLRELVIRNSIIQYLPADIFRLAPQLSTLIMHNCRLNRFNSEDFHNAGTLNVLSLQKNRISRLVGNQFGNLTQLLTLELGNNFIHMIHPEAFNNLTQLRYLGLQGNGIQTLSMDLFAPLVNLLQLDLSGNEITSVAARTFEHNVKLESLLLNGNRFSNFEPDALQPLKQLRLLDLNNCALDELRVTAVNTLLLQGSGVKRLVISERLVIRIHAGNNELTDIIISEPSAVLELDLHANLFKNVNMLTGMQNLQRLDLSKNNIRTLQLTEGTPYLALLSLTHLNIASNQLQELSADNFLLMPRLLQLDISFNHLLRLSAGHFEPLVRLEKLYIEGNRLHEFDYEVFQRNHAQLKELGVCENEWEFHYMRKMVTYLSNHGVHLPARFGKRTEAGNSVNTLTPATLAHFAGNMAQPPNAQAQHVGVGGIHPYWTTRDVLAFVTLLIVFMILLMQICQVLQEEGCFARCRRTIAAARQNRNGVARQTRPQHRPQRLNEEDSEV